MKKSILLFVLSLVISSAIYGQVMVTKLFGNNSTNTGFGWGVFSFFSFALNDMANQNIKLELIDFAQYTPENSSLPSAAGYLSIKLGYQYIFSDTQTGFYVEPEAGWCQVGFYQPDSLQNIYLVNGLALAIEGGYSLEVGQRGNTFDFGLKYESDAVGTQYDINSLGFRVSFSFHLFKRRND